METEENPYAPPRANDVVTGVRSGRRADLRSVAVAQKTIIVCILLNFVAIGAQFVIPPQWALFIGLGYLVIAIVQLVAVFSLAMRVSGTGPGILYGIGSMIPCIGLLILLMINSRATKILTANGHHVGLFGTDLSKF